MHFTISLSAALLAFRASVSAANPMVVIRQGTIIGTTTSVSGVKDAANDFYGIPFANAQRFGLPSSAPSWASIGPLAAVMPRAGCLQEIATELRWGRSEDCLHLDIHTPGGKEMGKGKGKTVMVFFHGGNLQTRDASDPMWNGANLAATQDVVVVSINYRLGSMRTPFCPCFCLASGEVLANALAYNSFRLPCNA